MCTRIRECTHADEGADRTDRPHPIRKCGRFPLSASETQHAHAAYCRALAGHQPFGARRAAVTPRAHDDTHLWCSSRNWSVTGESGRAESTSSKKPAEKTLRATATALARSAAPALTGKRRIGGSATP